MGNQELYRTLRIIFYVFCVWVFFNHTVRILALRASTKGGVLSYAGSATVKSLDLFRKKEGELFGRLKPYCPDSIKDDCDGWVDALRIGLGVN